MFFLFLTVEVFSANEKMRILSFEDAKAANAAIENIHRVSIEICDSLIFDNYWIDCYRHYWGSYLSRRTVSQ